jgi:hypothetical protein
MLARQQLRHSFEMAAFQLDGMIQLTQHHSFLKSRLLYAMSQLKKK